MDIELELLTQLLNGQVQHFDHDLAYVEHLHQSIAFLRPTLKKLIQINQDQDHEQMTKMIVNETEPEFGQQMLLAISCLQTFVLANWLHVGSLDLDAQLIECLDQILPSDYKENGLFIRNLAYCPPIHHVQLLYVARLLFTQIRSDRLPFILWKHRYIVIHQMVLGIQNDQLDEQLQDCQQRLLKQAADELVHNQAIRMCIFLEVCQANLQLNRVQHVQEYLRLAQSMSNLRIRLTAALGKRTFYQQQAKSLLKVGFERNQDDPQHEPLIEMNHLDYPKNLTLNDDTLMSKPQFECEQPEQVKLSSLEEVLVLSIVKFGLKCGVFEEVLLKEELMVYLDHLTCQAKCWSVLFESLFRRSRLECDQSRKIERALTQVAELIDRTCKQPVQERGQRLSFFYAVLPAPVWELQRRLAEMFVTIGCMKDALEIYKQLELWEEIVFCYNQLQRRDKAEEIIRQQLQHNETPYLLCLLGDATDDLDQYERAWEVSGRQSFLAQKKLGHFHFARHDYERALECYERSLSLNWIQLDALQKQAYAALELERYELAVRAYRRVVELDPENFLAWNNLSKAYIKLNEKSRAFHTLQEALKHNFDNWKIWENFIAVAVDVAAFQEVIQAWHRLIDLKGQYDDDQIMNIMVQQLCRQQEDQEEEKNQEDGQQQLDVGHGRTWLIRKCFELLGRVTSSSACSGWLWQLYAQLLLRFRMPNEMDKVANCLKRAQRSYTQTVDWEKQASTINEMLINMSRLHLQYDQCVQLIGDDQTGQRTNLLGSYRLCLRSVLNIVETRADYWKNDVQWAPEIGQQVQQLQAVLQQLS